MKSASRTRRSTIGTPSRRKTLDPLATPRSSRHDMREPPDSMTTSVEDDRDSSTPSPDEGRAIENSVPRPFRSLTSTKKAKRIKFYRNGDQYYKGMMYALHTDRVRSMKPLMEDLARTMGDSQYLPNGIRHIFTVDGQFRVTEVDQFEDGESYVCSSSETFKTMDYSNAKEPAWCSTLSRTRNIEASLTALNINDGPPEPTDFVEPRIITVIRNGVKPRKVIRSLLNKRSARSFDQVMRDLTAVVKLDSGAIRKVFTITGKPVTCLKEFFGDEDVFIAYGTEKHNADDFYVMSEEYKRVATKRRGGRSLPMRKRAMPSRNESLREDRCGSVIPDEHARHLPHPLSGTFSVVRLLGDGNTALVYEVNKRETGERQALKFISRENTLDKEVQIRSELAIMGRMEHNHIVKMFDHWEIEGSHYLAMELIEGGDLFDHLCNVRRISEKQACSLTGCLVKALRYLHERSIVHRDVKPENLLLFYGAGGQLGLKLADFGLATELPEDGSMLTTICGTPTYVAAEVLRESGYDHRVDIWSTGIIVYVMLCGFPPFQSIEGSQEDLFRQILRGTFSFPSPAWDNISWSVKHLILILVNLEMDERPPAENILDHCWLQYEGDVPKDVDTMEELSVKAWIGDQVEEVDLDETEREYYFSRRASMDEFSENGDFHYTRSYS